MMSHDPMQLWSQYARSVEGDMPDHLTVSGRGH